MRNSEHIYYRISNSKDTINLTYGYTYSDIVVDAILSEEVIWMKPSSSRFVNNWILLTGRSGHCGWCVISRFGVETFSRLRGVSSCRSCFDRVALRRRWSRSSLSSWTARTCLTRSESTWTAIQKNFLVRARIPNIQIPNPFENRTFNVLFSNGWNIQKPNFSTNSKWLL